MTAALPAIQLKGRLLRPVSTLLFILSLSVMLSAYLPHKISTIQAQGGKIMLPILQPYMRPLALEFGTKLVEI